MILHGSGAAVKRIATIGQDHPPAHRVQWGTWSGPACRVMQQGQAPGRCLALLGYVVRVLVTYWGQLAVKAASSMTKEVCSEVSSTPVKLMLVVPAGTVKDFWT